MSIGKARIKLLRLTNKGRRALGLGERTTKRQGGGTHAYWRGKVADHFRNKGYEVTEEAPIGGGKTVDVVAESGRERIAIEIETGNADAVANVRKCLDVGFDRVVCFALNKTVHLGVVRHPLARAPRVTIRTAANTLTIGRHQELG